MASPVSAFIPPGDLDELEDLIEASGGRLTKSGALRVALRKYLDDVRSGAIPDITLETEPNDPEKPRPERELGETLKGAISDVMDFVPLIGTRGETAHVTTSFNKDTVRALDVLLAQPGIRQKTRSDLVRALVHFGLQAVDALRAVEHPIWRTALVLARQRQAYERQVIIGENLYQGAMAFRDALAIALARGQVTEAMNYWVGYYQDALIMPESEADMMLGVLRTMPLAQRVAWEGRNTGLIPDEFIPSEQPQLSNDFDEGMPIPPQIQARRALLAQYNRDFYARQNIQIEGPTGPGE